MREPENEIDALASSVLVAAKEVHRCLGPGFLESTYERALCLELGARGLSYSCQYVVPLLYKGQPVGESHLDLLVEDRLVVELKAVDQLAEIHVAQTLAYLKATRLSLALLINFNVRILLQGVRRVVLSP